VAKCCKEKSNFPTKKGTGKKAQPRDREQNSEVLADPLTKTSNGLRIKRVSKAKKKKKKIDKKTNLG